MAERLASDIGLGAVIKPQRQSNSAQNLFYGVLGRQQAQRQKENSDALTSLDDYVVVDKNFLPSTAKQAVELSRDFNNKAMQLIGTPNAKNKIHDLYTKDYSVQLQMLRGANQAKLDYIDANRNHPEKFLTDDTIAMKFQTSEDPNEINALVAARKDPSLVTDGNMQIAFSPRLRFNEGTMFHTQADDYQPNGERITPIDAQNERVTTYEKLRPEVITGKKSSLLGNRAFRDTQLFEAPDSIRSQPNFNEDEYLAGQADKMLNEKLQINKSNAYPRFKKGDGKGLDLTINNDGSASNEKVNFAFGSGTQLLKNTDIYTNYVNNLEAAKQKAVEAVPTGAKYNEARAAVEAKFEPKSEEEFAKAYNAPEITFTKKFNFGENPNLTFSDAKGTAVNGEPIGVKYKGQGKWDIKVSKKIGQEQGQEIFDYQVVPYDGNNKKQLDLKYPGLEQYFETVKTQVTGGGKKNTKSDGFQTFTVKGITYKIPDSDVPEFKKDNGL